jgi:DNA-binding GntR family transcriptional regulator
MFSSSRSPQGILDTQIEPVSLVNSIADRFRQSIANGTFRPGEFVNESQFAEKLGVSRGTLREAIRILVAEGLLEKLPNRSSRVSILSSGKAWEIITLRAELEGFAARLLSQKLTPEKTERLRSICQKITEAAQANDGPSFLTLDYLLHQTILELSGHELLLEAWLRIAAWIRLMFASEVHSREELITNAINHQRIIEAIISGDQNQAEEVIKQDLLDQPELWRALKSMTDKPADPAD